jgi:hypothetical protein
MLAKVEECKPAFTSSLFSNSTNSTPYSLIRDALIPCNFSKQFAFVNPT